MKRGDHVPALLHPDGISSEARDDARFWTRAADDGSADEDGFHIMAVGLYRRDLAIDPPSVGVALDGNIHEAERRLHRMRDFAGEQNGSGAASIYGFLCGEGANGLDELLHFEELPHGGAFAARNDESITARDIGSRSYFDGLSGMSGVARAFDGVAVRFEIALQRQDTDGFQENLPISNYQPRVWSSSFSGILVTSRPRMGSPNSSLASRSFTGSRK